MPIVPRIDWIRILRDLRAIGLSLPKIARKIGTAPATPYRWIEGSTPLHPHGEALLELHRTRCGVPAGGAYAPTMVRKASITPLATK